MNLRRFDGQFDGVRLAPAITGQHGLMGSTLFHGSACNKILSAAVQDSSPQQAGGKISYLQVKVLR